MADPLPGLEALAKSLWENRYLLFKAEERLSEEEKERLAEIVQADQKVGRWRALGGRHLADL